jgi:hypothetical protein
MMSRSELRPLDGLRLELLFLDRRLMNMLLLLGKFQMLLKRQLACGPLERLRLGFV